MLCFFLFFFFQSPGGWGFFRRIHPGGSGPVVYKQAAVTRSSCGRSGFSPLMSCSGHCYSCQGAVAVASGRTSTSGCLLTRRRVLNTTWRTCVCRGHRSIFVTDKTLYKKTKQKHAHPAKESSYYWGHIDQWHVIKCYSVWFLDFSDIYWSLQATFFQHRADFLVSVHRFQIPNGYITCFSGGSNP